MPEKSLIERVRRRARPGQGVAIGIGDDCAVLRVPPGHEILLTTDFTLENVHFRRAWHPPDVVGRRCLTRGLSDIAAMGGHPRAAFLSLALDSKTPQTWVDRFLDGLLAAAQELRIPLAGGDTAQSAGGIQVDIIVLGSLPKGKAVLRSGAQPGDYIYVTGELGGSAAAIAQFEKMGQREPAGSRSVQAPPVPPEDYKRHFSPTARIAVGLWLRRRGFASSMIDISDGLSTDLQHLCEESKVGAEVDGQAIPRARVGRPGQSVSLDLALHGGEDYELLFTSAKKMPRRIAGVDVSRIGSITRTRAIVLIDKKGKHQRLSARGWEHFRQ